MAWRKIQSYDGKGAFKGWLCRIAYTQFLQHKRSAKASQRREDEAMMLADQTEEHGPGSEARMDLDRLLKVLTPEQRAAVALCYGEGMSHAEAAEALGLPLGTIKSHVLRGRERMLAAASAKEARA